MGRDYSGTDEERREEEAVDHLIGSRLRGIRTARGLSQTEVAERVNLSFQQIQKYEAGRSRVTVSKLNELARALEVPIGFFFEDWDDSSGENSHLRLFSEEAWLAASLIDRISNPKTSKKLLDLIKSLVED